MDPVDPGLVAEKTAEMKAQKIAAKLKKRPKETPDLADLLSKSPMCSSDTLSFFDNLFTNGWHETC